MIIYHIRSDGVNDHNIEWTGGPGIPSGYTRKGPPEHGEDQHAVWVGRWVIVDGPVPPLPPPPVPVPSAISMRQCRLQLLAMNLLDTVDAAVAEMDQAAQIEWEYATEVLIDNPLVLGMKDALGMSDEDLRQFFIEAAKPSNEPLGDDTWTL